MLNGSAACLETPFSTNNESTSILSENGILLLRPTLDNAFPSTWALSALSYYSNKI